MATGFNVRVGDADRDAVAAQLREHYADGRLTLEELNERLDQTFAAKTKADLNTVMRDLPQARSRPLACRTGAPRGRDRPGRVRWPPSRGRTTATADGEATSGPRGMGNAFAPLMGLIWFFVILGSVFLFGLGGGDRPLAIVLFLAALALVKRLFGLGRRRALRRAAGSQGTPGTSPLVIIATCGFRAGPARLIVGV